jgi:hypothetical protein
MNISSCTYYLTAWKSPVSHLLHVKRTQELKDPIGLFIHVRDEAIPTCTHREIHVLTAQLSSDSGLEQLSSSAGFFCVCSTLVVHWGIYRCSTLVVQRGGLVILATLVVQWVSVKPSTLVMQWGLCVCVLDSRRAIGFVYVLNSRRAVGYGMVGRWRLSSSSEDGDDDGDDGDC